MITADAIAAMTGMRIRGWNWAKCTKTVCRRPSLST